MKGIVYRRRRWKEHPVELWLKRCLKCEETKLMPVNNFICSGCKRASPNLFSRAWGPEIYNTGG